MDEIRTTTMCFLLVGIVLTIVGITAVTTPENIPEASADAELVSYESHEEYDNSGDDGPRHVKRYTPVYAFLDRDGITRHVRGDDRKEVDYADIGLKTLVYYDPTDPEGKSAIVDCEHDWEHNDSKLGLLIGIFTTVTGILLLVADVMRIASKRRERASQAPPSVAP